MPLHEKNKTLWWAIGLVFFVGIGTVVVQLGGLHNSRQFAEWVRFDVHQRIFPEPKAEGPTYDETAKGPVSLATFVRQLRVAWPGENLATVHGAAGEVATGLLHHGDIEVGSLENGKFVAWSMSPWEAEEKIRTELMAQSNLFTNENRYVFRRKPGAKP